MTLNSYPDIDVGSKGDDTSMYFQTKLWSIDCSTGMVSGSWGSLDINVCAISGNPKDSTDTATAPQSVSNRRKIFFSQPSKLLKY